MNHITHSQSLKLAREAAYPRTANTPMEAQSLIGIDEIHTLCNAAIEWHIAQQAASVDATFKKWNAEKAASEWYAIKYGASAQHEPENEPAVSLASQAAPKEPLTDMEVEVLAICRRHGKVSVSQVQRILCIGWEAAHELCQSIIDAGQVNGLEISPTLDLYKKDQKTNTSQERVHKTGESEQVPLSTTICNLVNLANIFASDKPAVVVEKLCAAADAMEGTV